MRYAYRAKTNYFNKTFFTRNPVGFFALQIGTRSLAVLHNQTASNADVETKFLTIFIYPPSYKSTLQILVFTCAEI